MPTCLVLCVKRWQEEYIYIQLAIAALTLHIRDDSVMILTCLLSLHSRPGVGSCCVYITATWNHPVAQEVTDTAWDFAKISGDTIGMCALQLNQGIIFMNNIGWREGAHGLVYLHVLFLEVHASKHPTPNLASDTYILSISSLLPLATLGLTEHE